MADNSDGTHGGPNANPITPPGPSKEEAAECVTPSKRRKLRTGEVRKRLWQRTRWRKWESESNEVRHAGCQVDLEGFVTSDVIEQLLERQTKLACRETAEQKVKQTLLHRKAIRRQQVPKDCKATQRGCDIPSQRTADPPPFRPSVSSITALAAVQAAGTPRRDDSLTSGTTMATEVHGNDFHEQLCGIPGIEREVVSPVHQKCVQAVSMAHSGWGGALAFDVAQLFGTSTLPELVLAYMNLHDREVQHLSANDHALKQVMRCIRDQITRQACSEQGLSKFCATLSRLFGSAWDGNMKSQFLLSFSKCSVRGQCERATRGRQCQQRATARRRSTMLAEQSKSSESVAALPS